MSRGSTGTGAAVGRSHGKSTFRWLILLAAAGAIVSPAWAAVPTPVWTLAEYHSALLRVRAIAIAAARPPSSPASTAASRSLVLAALPLQLQVRMPNGRMVDVDNRPLAPLMSDPTIGEARATGRTFRRFRRPRLSANAGAGWQRLVRTVDSILAATPAATLSPMRVDAGRVLRDVLSRPEYRYEQPKPTLLERFFDWLGRQIERFFLWLARLLERLFPASDRSPGHTDRLARLMVIGVVLLLAVLIARLILVILPNLRRLRRGEGDTFAAGGVVLPREPETLLAEAEREAAAGRYREALRLAYLATVARLDRAGVLSEDRSRTHWELLRDLRRLARDERRETGDEEGDRTQTLVPRHSSLVTLLSPLTLRLDERLYGGRTATLEDYQACRAAHDQIVRLLCAPA